MGRHGHPLLHVPNEREGVCHGATGSLRRPNIGKPLSNRFLSRVSDPAPKYSATLGSGGNP